MVGRTGSLLSDSQRPGTRGVAYDNRPEIAAALAGRTVQGRRRSDTLDQELLYTAVPIVNEGRTVGAVRLTQSVDAIDRETRRDQYALFGVGALALLLGLVVAWFVAGSLARPLRSSRRPRGAWAGATSTCGPRWRGRPSSRTSRARSTRWPTGSRTRSTPSASSSPMRRTSCALR